MSSRTHRRWVLVASLLCGAAHPAFADGSIPSAEQWHQFLYLVASIIVAVIAVVVLVVRLIGRAARAANRREEAKAVEPDLPIARIVQDSDKP